MRMGPCIVFVVVGLDEGPGPPAAAAGAGAAGARGVGAEAVERPGAGDGGAPACAGVEVLAEAGEVVLVGRRVGREPLASGQVELLDVLRRKQGEPTSCLRASSAVGRFVGSGLSSVLTKSLAVSGLASACSHKDETRDNRPCAETLLQYRSWNSIFAAVVSRMSSFMSSERNGE